MTWQYVMLFSRHWLESSARRKPIGDRIRLWLCRINAEVRRNRRQELIAPKDKIVVLRPECDMFRRMPVANTDCPLPSPGENHLTVLNPRISKR